MTTKFTTKKGRGALCYRVPRKQDGETLFSEDFYRRIKRGGRQYYFKLGPEKRMAETISNAIDDFLRDPRNSIDEAVLKFNPDAKYRKRNQISLGEILQVHKELESALELTHKTGNNYRTRLMWAVRRVQSHRKKHNIPKQLSYAKSLDLVADFSIRDLNATFLSDLKLAEMKDAGDSPLKQNNVKRRLKSVMADARSVFSDAAMHEYEQRGYELPDLSSFLRTRLFQRVSRTSYHLPSNDAIRAIFGDAQELRIRPNAYRVYLLALAGGLRRKEIFNLKWSWIKSSDPAVVSLPLTDDFEQKGHGESTSELCGWAYKELCNFATEGVDRVIEGTEADKNRDVKFLTRWLREKGLDRKKPVHELRMLYGSYLANRRGLYAAQKLLRHKDSQVTSDHYADLIPDESVLLLWERKAS